MTPETYREHTPERPTQEKILEVAKKYLDRVKDNGQSKELKDAHVYANEMVTQDFHEWAIGKPSPMSSYPGWEPDDFVSLLKEMGEDVSDIPAARAEYMKQQAEYLDEDMRPWIHSLEALIGIVHSDEGDLMNLEELVSGIISDPEKQTLVLKALSVNGRVYIKDPEGAKKLERSILKKAIEVARGY